MSVPTSIVPPFDGDEAPPFTLAELQVAQTVREYRVAIRGAVASLVALTDGRHVLIRERVDRNKHLLHRAGSAVMFQAEHLADALDAGATWAAVGFTDGSVRAASLGHPEWSEHAHPVYGVQHGLPLARWVVIGTSQRGVA